MNEKAGSTCWWWTFRSLLFLGAAVAVLYALGGIQSLTAGSF